MKTIISLLISLLCTITIVTAETTEKHTYLKIKLDNHQEISYPPGTGFVAEDASGNAVLSPSQLEELKEYTITEPITLWVFTAWSDEPDTYELSSGTLVMEESDYEYDGSNPYDFGRFKKGQNSIRSNKDEDYVTSKKGKTSGAWKGTSNGLVMTQTRFFDYDNKTGYDTSIEFNNDVVFYYRDGKAEAWQYGKSLKMEGKYLIYTNLGIIKLSYNPQNKEIWYVFEKNN